MHLPVGKRQIGVNEGGPGTGVQGIGKLVGGETRTDKQNSINYPAILKSFPRIGLNVSR